MLESIQDRLSLALEEDHWIGTRSFEREGTPLGSKNDHLLWAASNADLAEKFWEHGEATERRWATVAAYYSLLHVAQAIAADLYNAHPEHHWEVFEVPLRVDANRTSLSAQLQESYNISHNARYLKAGDSPSTWYEPYFTDEETAIDKAMSLMRTVGPELKRLVGWS